MGRCCRGDNRACFNRYGQPYAASFRSFAAVLPRIAAFSSSLSEVQARCDRRMELPGVGIVAAQDDLAGADLGHEMADRFGRENQ